MRTRHVLALAVLVVLALCGSTSVAEAAVCADYPNQAAAQRAADTRDADGDGIYCESLPCPCSTGGGGGNPTPAPAPKPKASCTRPQGVQRLRFSRSRYPGIRRHYVAAVGKGWPRILVVNRRGADQRRDRLMDEAALPTRDGFDRDEYPPAVGRGRRNGDPVAWSAA